MSIAKRLASQMDHVRFEKKTFGAVRFDLFFDRNAVVTRFDAKELKVLSRTGAWGRGYIRRLIRPGGKKGKQSDPGQPPRFHHRGFASLKDGIFFTANLDRGLVDIGASKIRTQVRPIGKASSAQLLEEGGRGEITSWRSNKDHPGEWKKRIGTWRKRPYLDPAIEPTGQAMVGFMKSIDL